ncbi:MAG: OsmC family protein, partial [Actinomycetota bacterium]
FRTEGMLVGACEVDISAAGFEFKVDEPVAVGGGGVAAGPAEYALAALASCQAITFRFWAEQLGVAIDKVKIRTEGEMDFRGFFGFEEGVRPGFGGVQVHIEVSGPEAPERYEELTAAVQAHCPILDVFKNPVPVTTTVSIG